MTKRTVKQTTKAKEAASSSNPKGTKKGKKASTSSTSPAVEGQPPYDTTKFRSYECYKWYELHKGKDFVVETTIDPSIDATFGIEQMFKNLGWDAILDLKGEYYPDLVLQFYANVLTKDKQSTNISSWVKGTKLILNAHYLFRHFGFSKDGQAPDFHTHDQERPVWNERTWERSHVLEKLNIPTEFGDRNREIFRCKYMEIPHRLVAYMLGHNVDPKGGDVNTVRVTDLYYMDKLIFGIERDKPLPLADIVIDVIGEFLKPSRFIRKPIFPMLISKMLVKEGVDVSDEAVRYTDGTHVLNRAKLLSFKYTCRNGVWTNDHRRNREFLAIPETEQEIEGAAADGEVPDPNSEDETPPPPSRPRGERPLSNASFQRQVLSWMQKIETQVSETRATHSSLQAQLNTILEQQSEILRSLGLRDPPPS